MGGERSSTTRMRERGEICCNCKIRLPPPPPKERFCARCAPKRRIYMHYVAVPTGWQVQFSEEDLRTALPKRFTFASADKVIEMAERGGAVMTLEGRQALEHGIGVGRGGVWLSLTKEQYDRLR